MKVLFFAPHSAIWVHAFPEALVAEALRDGGHDVVYVTCGRVFRGGCIAMTAYGLGQGASVAERDAICCRCEVHKDLLREKFGLRGFDVADVLTIEDRAEIARLLATATPDNLLDIEACGIPAGRAALYEFLLEYKKSEIAFADENEWLRYRTILENTLSATFAARRFIDREQPDAVVVYNALYSVNRVVCLLAAAAGKRTYFLHAGGNLAHRLQTLMLSKGHIFDFMRQAIDVWPRYRDVPIDGTAAHLVTDHFLELLNGRSVFSYSSPRRGINGLRERFGVRAQQKVMCATLSSNDERFAAEAIGVRTPPHNLLFETQAEWVRALVDYVASRPLLFLIIRVHPREFPNKREGVKSAHARQLEALLQRLPNNVAVNWPADELSVYDLAEITDVFLNAWSSVGKEMGMLGIPVVSYSPELSLYPVDPKYCGVTQEDYFAALERALADGWCYENIVRVYRWCAIEYRRMLVDIADGFDAVESRASRLIERGWAKLRRSLDPYTEQKRDCARRSRRISASSQINIIFESGASSPLDAGEVVLSGGLVTVETETRVIKSEIGRIRRAMFSHPVAAESRLDRWLADLSEVRHLA